MRLKPLAVVFAFVLTVPACALAVDSHTAHGTTAQNSTSAQDWVEGTVKKLDRPAGKVTLAHGPLTNLGMPAMTMVFRVKDAAWLSQMKEGGKIRFMADSLGGTLTVVRFEGGK